MFLTSRERLRSSQSHDSFPAGQLALLALVRLAEPIALTSIFPYAYQLVLSYHVGPKSDAALYAGILIAAFSLAESLSGMFWGGLSDRLGRKPILLCGCAGTVLSLLVVGFASNFWMALFGRALGGLLNGNIGVIQTMVGELVKRPEHEPRAYAIMPLMWAIGATVGPAIGGCLANPSENFPAVFSSHGLFARYPYFLPNLVCALLLVVAIIAGYFAIEETHPDMQLWDNDKRGECSVETPLMAAAGATGHAPADLRAESYGTFNAVDTDETRIVTLNGHEVCARPSIYTRRVVMLVVALGIFTYHSMTYDNLLPIFLEDDRMGDEVSAMSTSDVLAGGLGLSTKQVGMVMTVNGIIALFMQAVVFPLAASWLGVWRLFFVVTMGHPISYFIVPYLAFLPVGAVYPGIYGALAVRNLFSILAYPVLLILIKDASPGPSHLGKINGLAASVGAACRTMASPVAGFLYGLGMTIDFTPLAWWASAFIAAIGALQLLFIRRYKVRTHVHDATHFARNEATRAGAKCEVVQIIVRSTLDDLEHSDLDDY